MAEDNSSSSTSSGPFNHDLVLYYKFPQSTYTYTERDVALYALGVGVCGQDAVDADELKYAYHENGQRFIQVLPTFSTIFLRGFMLGGQELPGLQYDPRLLLHGQQYIEIYKPLPSSAHVNNQLALAGLHDKGKAAIIEIETKSYEKESGDLLCLQRSTMFLRGAGGFSNSFPPYSYSKYSPNEVKAVKIPESHPFAVFEDCTRPSQALLYRLSGDYNPLHSDPMIAEVAGGDANLIKNIFGRFLLPVYPGETLITEMWLEGLRVIYQTKVKERSQAALSGFVDVHHHLNSSF